MGWLQGGRHERDFRKAVEEDHAGLDARRRDLSDREYARCPSIQPPPGEEQRSLRSRRLSELGLFGVLVVIFRSALTHARLYAEARSVSCTEAHCVASRAGMSRSMSARVGFRAALLVWAAV